MLKVNTKVKLAIAALATAPAAGAAYAQSLSYINFGGPGTSYTQDFNTLPFAISNLSDPKGTVGFSGTGGNALIFRNNAVGVAGNVYDLGNTGTDPATSILYAAFQANTQNTYPTSVAADGTVVTSVPVAPVLTSAQASAAFNRAASAMTGWSVANYLASTATSTSAFRFLADNGGPSNTGSVRSFGPTANGLVQNGTVVATGATFDPTTTDTNAFPFQDRALGALGSGTGNNLIALTLRNNSNSVISSINIGSLVEEWRHGTTATDTFRGSYLISDTVPDASVLQTDSGSTGTFTRAAQMDVFSPVPSYATQTSALNGNVTPFRYAANASLPVTLLPGQYIVLRYNDLDSPGTDDGLGLDDFTVTATGAAIPASAHFLTYNGAHDSTVVVGGQANFVTNGASATLATGDVLTLDNTGLSKPNIVIGTGGGAGTVGLSLLSVSNTSGTYTLSGDGISAPVGLLKTQAGTLSLANGANDFGTFGVRISGGAVQFANPNQLGSAAVPVLLDGGATLQPTGASASDLSANTLSLIGTGGTFSNAGSVTLGTLSGSGGFVKAGAGNLTLNNYFATGSFRISSGTVTMAIPASQQVNLQNTDGGTINGNLVLANPVRVNLNTATSANGGNGGVLGGTGTIFADVSGATISTIDSGSFFTSIQVPIVLNRNNLPSFQFNIFPGFAGASRLQLDRAITGPGGAVAHADLNFAAGPVYGAGSVVVNQPLLYDGKTTINVIGGTSGGVTGGGFVVMGVNNAFPATTTLGFDTVSGFNQGSSGSGYLSLGNSLANGGNGGSFSQTFAGLYSGNGDAPQSSFTNMATAFGGIANAVTGTDPIATKLTLNIASGATFSYTGQLFSLFSLVKTGPGTQRLGAVYFGDGSGGVPQTSNYTGTTDIKQGTVEAFGGANRLSFNSPLTLGDSAANTAGVLILDGIGQTVAALASTGTASGNAIVANSGSVNGTNSQVATLTVLSQDFNDTSFFAQDRYRDFVTTTFAGKLADGTAQLSIVKTAQTVDVSLPPADLGELHLTGSLAYSGNTTVTGGRLVLASPLRPLQVNPATTLGSVVATGTGRLTLAAAVSATPTITAQVSSISLSGGGRLIVPVTDRAGHAGNVVVANALSIDAQSFLDLGTGDMIVHGGGSQLPVLTSAVSNWYDGGARDGLGLGSSAFAQGAALSSLTSLGMIVNDDGMGGGLFTAFDGVPVSAGDLLVKYTYLGDTDLNGYVDSNDLANLLAGMSGGLTGWVNGDTNYDGKVDMIDLTNLLASLQGQGGPFIGGGTGGSGAVPEPAGLAWSLLAVPMLARRRRR